MMRKNMETMENKGGFEPFLISFLEGAVFSFKRLFRVFPQQQWPVVCLCDL